MRNSAFWPSKQPLRPWSRVCHATWISCDRYAIPGQEYCEDHIGDGLPTIVCLCGSTRYWETFQQVALDLTMAGIIVLSIGTSTPESMVFAHPESDEGKAQKEMLDKLHKRKIVLATQVLVLNVEGYVGDSTRSEIQHAIRTGRTINWLFPDMVPEL